MLQLFRVTDGLFISSARSACSEELFKQEGVTFCINVSKQQPFPRLQLGKLRIPVSDEPVEPLCNYFEQCFDVIRSTVSMGGKCLVYCKNGRSRSATVCTAYLMKQRSLNLKDAFQPKLQDWLQTLRKELGAAQEGKLKEEENYKGLRNKLEAERKEAETEFQKLRQLLKDQEQTLLRKLEEMDKKIARVENANITKLSAEMSSLEALIAEIVKKRDQSAEELLQDIRSTLNRYEHVMDEKPERIMKKYKVHVMLDEDTAHDCLALSEGGRRVRYTATRQNWPDNPKRFTHSLCVLGREGFTSGRHYWELQLLQDGGVWIVGVIRESKNRKEGITRSPETGAWALGGYDGRYWAVTSLQTPLFPHQHPLKLGLYLDHEGGRLSVYNADNMEALYTFTDAAFNGRVYPLFYVDERADLRLV